MKTRNKKLNIFGTLCMLVHGFSRRLKSPSCMSNLHTVRKPIFRVGESFNSKEKFVSRMGITLKMEKMTVF